MKTPPPYIPTLKEGDYDLVEDDVQDWEDDFHEDVEIVYEQVSTDLHDMFVMQEALMRRYHERAKSKGYYMPDWPVDISSKRDQQACREAGLKSVEEFFESLQHLKNWKPHRNTEVKEFNRDAFLEEIADHFHYYLELLIFMGISPTEFVEAYTKKNTKNHQRLDDGY